MSTKFKLINKAQSELRGSEQVGSEYILELIGSESVFKDKRLYIHCLICNYYGEISTLRKHQISYGHRIKFLVSFIEILNVCIN